MHYTDADLQAIQAQQKKRWLLLGSIILVFLAGMIVSFIFRIEWITTGCTIVAGALLIGGWDLLIKSLHCYEVHLRNVLKGRTRTVELPFNAMDEDISVVEGVRYYAMTVNDIDGKGKPYERLFYYDAEKPRPDFQTGDMLRIVFHDKEIGSIEKI